MRCRAAACLVAIAACSDPELTVRIDYRHDATLATAASRWQVSIHELTGVTCAEVRYGRVSDADLALGLRATVALGTDGGPLAGVPRLGDKLAILAGFDDAGERLVAGCEEFGDIVDDTEVVVDAQPTTSTRVVPTPAQVPSVTLPRAPGLDDANLNASLAVFVRERRPPHAPLVDADDDPTAPKQEVRVFLRTVAGEIELAEATLSTDADEAADGIMRALLLRQVPRVNGRAIVGAAELVIRAPWADRVERVPVFVPAAPLGNVLTAPPGQSNQLGAPWQVITQQGGGDDLRGAVLAQVSGAPRHITLLTEVGGQIAVPAVARIVSPEAAEARALAGFAGATPRIVTRLATGWYAVDHASATLVPVTPHATTTADELVPIPDCDDASHLGLLVRTAAVWTGFAGLSATPAAGGPAAGLAARMNTFVASHPDAAIEDVVCVTVGAEVIPTIIATAQVDTRRARFAITTPAVPIELPFAGAIAIARWGSTFALVGPIETSSGIRVLSYRLNVMPLRLVPDGVIDYPVPAAPTAMAVVRADTDAYPDLLAITTYQGRIGLSMTYGGARPGDELTSLWVTPQAEGGAPRLFRAPLLENDDLQLLVGGRHAAGAFDMLTPEAAPAP